MSARRILYHCTQFDHGPELVVQRRFPIIRATGEPKTPRLCVAPSVAQCLVSSLMYRPGAVQVYATRQPMAGVTPLGVWDEVITWERWLLPGQRLVKVDTVDDATRAEVVTIPTLYHEAGNLASFHSRVAHLLIIDQEVPNLITQPLRLFLRRIQQRFKIGCPFQWFAEHC